MKNRYFKTIAHLVLALSDNGIPCYVEDLYDGYKVTFPGCDGDVIAHSYMLGRGECEYTVESMGFRGMGMTSHCLMCRKPLI